MSIPFNYKFKSIANAIRLKRNLIGNKEKWVAWHYCGIYKNEIDGYQPNVLVAFRKLLPDGLSNDTIMRRVPLTALGQVKIGTVWLNSMCHQEADFDLADFFIDFTKDSWRFISFKEAVDKRLTPPYPQSIYPLQYREDKNWFIEFRLQSGGKLIVPCVEFFSRCYGRSELLKRILATFTWTQVEGKLYSPFDEPEEFGIWKVKLKERLVNGDIVFLAHAKYDPFTQGMAKNVYGQIESQFDPESTDPLFIQIGPWFQGPAQIRVKGIWFDNRQSFVGLQIIGCSDPSGVPLVRDREKSNKNKNTAKDGEMGEAWSGMPKRHLTQTPIIFDLTGDEAPDHGADTVEIQDSDFVVLGEARIVYDVRKNRPQENVGTRSDAVPSSFSSEVSSGDPHGNGKGVGYASIYAPSVMESHGILRDMWNALRFTQKKRPDLIQSVEWLSSKDGFRKETEPMLIR